MDFFSSLTLPSQTQPFKIKELKYKDFLILQKFLQNNIDEDIICCFDSLIKEYCIIPSNVILSFFDKFILLVYIRILSIGGDLEIPLKDKSVFKLELLPFLNKLLNNKEIIFKDIKEGNNCIIQLGLPLTYKFDTIFDFGEACIHTIYLNKKLYEFDKMSTAAKDIVLSNFSSGFNNILREYSQEMETQFNKIELPLPKEISENNIVFSLKSGVLMELLKLFLRVNLHEIYQKNYSLMAHANMSLTDMLPLAPAELNVFYSLMNKEHEEIDRKTEKSPTQFTY